MVGFDSVGVRRTTIAWWVVIVSRHLKTPCDRGFEYPRAPQNTLRSWFWVLRSTSKHHAIVVLGAPKHLKTPCDRGFGCSEARRTMIAIVGARSLGRKFCRQGSPGRGSLPPQNPARSNVSSGDLRPIRAAILSLTKAGTLAEVRFLVLKQTGTLLIAGWVLIKSRHINPRFSAPRDQLYRADPGHRVAFAEFELVTDLAMVGLGWPVEERHDSWYVFAGARGVLANQVATIVGPNRAGRTILTGEKSKGADCRATERWRLKIG